MERKSENPVPWLVFEPVGAPLAEPPPPRVTPPAVTVELAAKLLLNEEVSVPAQAPAFYWPDNTGMQIVRATRSWIQYGTVGFAVLCIIIGAVEGLAGR